MVPRDLAPRLHGVLRRHFGDDPSIEVVVERRGDERRLCEDRRAPSAQRAAIAPTIERRVIHSRFGRRVAERRALLVSGSLPALPRKAHPFAGRLVFVERLEPSGLELEDRASAWVVVRFQAGEREAFSELYLRYYDRIYAYLRVVLRSESEAEECAQDVFLRALESLPRYENRGRPLAAWLFTIARNEALGRQRGARPETTEPEPPDDVASEPDVDRRSLGALDWISDPELLMFVERLPQAQRQALVLRFVFDLPCAEVASILGRSGADVRQLQTRALPFLRARLDGLGRGTERRGERIRMRAPLRKSRVTRGRLFALRRAGTALVPHR